MKKYIQRKLWVDVREDLALRRTATGFGVSVETYLRMVVFHYSVPRPTLKTTKQKTPACVCCNG